MAQLKNYDQLLVHQRRTSTGCIPTGIEWMFRFALRQGSLGQIKPSDLDDFQERFDLDHGNSQPQNNFDSVPAAVAEAFPEIQFHKEDFATGAEKLRRIEELLEQQIPCLLSLSNGPGKGWHIMPVVEVAGGEVVLLTLNGSTVVEQRRTIAISEVVRRHDEYPGGKDILVWGD